MRKIRLLSILLFAFSFIIVGCTKEGPEGPVGAVGPQGPAGNPGTANVIFSAWTNFVTATWSAPTVFFGVTQRIYPVTTATITPTFLDNGVLLVYYRVPGAAPGIAFVSPFVYNYGLPSGQQLRHQMRVGGFDIIHHNLTAITSDPGIIGPPNGYRYILIPGGVLGGRGVNPGVGGTGYTEAELRAMSYERVCALLNIPK